MSGTALRERLALQDELRQIVSAMRNLAYAELQRINRLQSARQKAERVVLRALADTYRADRLTARERVARRSWLIVGAERGFCGGFNDQLADVLPALRREDPDARWLVAGARMRQRVEDALPGAQWLPGCSSPDESAPCVDSWMPSLVSIGEGGGVQAPQLWVMHHGETGIVRRQLLPLPELPAPSPGAAVQRQLPLRDLFAKLLAQWLRVGLLAALHDSMQQENRWRLAQMQRASDYLDEAADRLKRRYFRQRQSEITSELETLMSSLSLQRGFPAGPLSAGVLPGASRAAGSPPAAFASARSAAPERLNASPSASNTGAHHGPGRQTGGEA